MDRLRLAELCAATSLFTDLGTGQPTEHGLRTCLVAMRLADALGLEPDTRRELFYVALLRFLGCTADAHLVADTAGGDDVRFLAALAPVTMGSPREEIPRLVRMVADGAPLPRRLVKLARELSDPASKERLLDAHCEVASRLARQMGLPYAVVNALDMAYARWDGGGVPRGIGGKATPASIRVSIVARDVELWARETDPEVTGDVLRRRRERAYDPDVVDAALDLGVEELRRFSGDLWEAVLELEPGPWAEVSGPEVDRALVALGDFADLKAPELSGHSRRVARIVAAAAKGGRLESEAQMILDRAAFAHDLGVVALPAGLWRTTEKLGPGDWEKFRLHPMWTQRILSRCAVLKPVGEVAGLHHERRDGSGYPSGFSGDLGRAAGLLACAEMYDEHTVAAPGGAADPADLTARQMARLAGEGALAPADVEAVLSAVGASRLLVSVERPAGLTEREVDVLSLLAKGNTNRRIAAALGISPRTVGTHIEHVYAKAGVRSRAAATLFAMENGLMD